MVRFTEKRYGFVKGLLDHPKETLRKTGHQAVDYVADNPLDTATYVAGDLVLPGWLAKKAAKKWKGPKGKMAAGALGVYAMSPVGLTAAGIAAKNKWKAKKKEKEFSEEGADRFVRRETTRRDLSVVSSIAGAKARSLYNKALSKGIKGTGMDNSRLGKKIQEKLDADTAYREDIESIGTEYLKKRYRK